MNQLVIHNSYYIPSFLHSIHHFFFFVFLFYFMNEFKRRQIFRISLIFCLKNFLQFYNIIYLSFCFSSKLSVNRVAWCENKNEILVDEMSRIIIVCVCFDSFYKSAIYGWRISIDFDEKPHFGIIQLKAPKSFTLSHKHLKLP